MLYVALKTLMLELDYIMTAVPRNPRYGPSGRRKTSFSNTLGP